MIVRVFDSFDVLECSGLFFFLHPLFKLTSRTIYICQGHTSADVAVLSGSAFVPSSITTSRGHCEVLIHFLLHLTFDYRTRVSLLLVV